MSYLFIIAMVLAAWHFIYDGIILPSIRLMLKNRLFEIRDRLRTHKIKSGNNIDINAFNIVHSGVNNIISRVSHIDIQTNFKIKQALKDNPDLLDKLKKRIDTISSCKDEELKSIFKETNSVVRMAFLANTGGWFIYLLPVALIFVFIKKLSLMAKGIVVLPGSKTTEYIPQDSSLA